MLKGGLIGCRKRLITLRKSLLPQVSRKIPEKAKRQELLRSAGAWYNVSLPPGAHPSASAEVGLLGYVNPSSAVAALSESSETRHGGYLAEDGGGHDSPVKNFSLGSGLAQKNRPLEVALEYDFEPFFEFI